jgi:hypothetical protein
MAFASLKNSGKAQSSFSLQREPNTCLMPQTACGTPVQFQEKNWPLHTWVYALKGSKKGNQHDSYEKHTANLRKQPYEQSRDSSKHTKPCEKHGGMSKTPWGGDHCTNKKNLKKKPNVLHQVNCKHEITSLTECAHVPLSLRIKKLEQSQQKILQWIKK